MNAKNYRLPAFVHFFERDGVIAAYNSLKLEPVYFFDQRLIGVLKNFANGNTASQVLSKFNKEVGQIFQKCLGDFLQKKILVDANVTDENILKYFQDVYTGKPYISIAYFILTDHCNFACKYCFIKNRMPSGYKYSMMNENIFMNGLNTFCRLISAKPEYFQEEKTIVIYGGEPLLNPKILVSLLEEIEKRKESGALPEKTLVNMVTNGSLITIELARSFKKFGLNVAISLDGDRLSTDSARVYSARESSDYESIITGFELLRNEGVNVGLSCTLNTVSLDNFEETIDTIINKLGVDGLGFNVIIDSPNYQLPENYEKQAASALIRAYEIFRKRGVSEDRIIRKVSAFIEKKIYAFDCGASGGSQIVIAPDGQIGICHGYLGSRKFFTTNVFDEKFDPEKNQVFLEWSRRSPLNMPACFGCIALGICGGGCPMSADFISGNIWELDQRFCVHAKMTLEWLIWDLYQKSN